MSSDNVIYEAIYALKAAILSGRDTELERECHRKQKEAARLKNWHQKQKEKADALELKVDALRLENDRLRNRLERANELLLKADKLCLNERRNCLADRDALARRQAQLGAQPLGEDEPL